MSTSGNSTPGRYEWIRIAESSDHFVQGKKKYFFLADTVWMAFLNCDSMEDWEEYLDFRAQQGFNVLQMQCIPSTHDPSESPSSLFPFPSRPGGELDFGRLSDAYFKRAVEMMDLAKARGFIPAFGILWCNWVPGTWAAKMSPRTAMPFENAKSYIREAVKTFAPYQPLYLASGDTRFDSPEETRYYRMVLEEIKATDPQALTTMHLSPEGILPDEFVRSKHLDFYMYQSGHHVEHPERPYALAQDFLAKPVKRPIVNGEPPYEGHGHGFRYGRFSSFEVRRAIWQSLLSGAKAGVTYGAHGIWMWHRKGMRFTSEQFSGLPFQWRTAMRLPGAWDAGLARRIFEQHDLFELEPCAIVRNEKPGIRASAAPDGSTIAVYIPFATQLELAVDLAGYDVQLINLAEREWVTPEVECGTGSSTVRMADFNADGLLIARKR